VTAKKVTATGPDQLTLLTPLTPLDGAKKVKKAKSVTRSPLTEVTPLDGRRPRPVPVARCPVTPWEAGAPPLDTVRAGVAYWEPIQPHLTDDQLHADLDQRAGGAQRAATFDTWQPYTAPTLIARSDEGGFRVERCRRCGHTVGEHKSSRTRGPLPIRYGVCLHPGCGCPGFEPKGTPPS
jgi:hypothetical protein